MIEARLIVEEFDEDTLGTDQEDWGAFRFETLPHGGDTVRVVRHGKSRDLKVLRVLHIPVATGEASSPTAYVITE